MKTFFAFAAVAALSACASHSGLLSDVDPTGGQSFCDDPGSPICRFLNAPVRLQNRDVRLPGRPYIFHETRERLAFVDNQGRRWNAPVGTLTDGASIPALFAELLGSPTSQEFVNAAVMHDAMCGIGNTELPGFHSATWEQTHRMFYEGLRVGGTDETRAKLMFAAVYLGGPRWTKGDKTFDSRSDAYSDPRISTQGAGAIGPQTRGLDRRALGSVSDHVLQGILRQTMAFIKSGARSIGDIETFITSQEHEAVAGQERGEADPVPHVMHEDDDPPVTPVQEIPPTAPIQEVPPSAPAQEAPPATPASEKPAVAPFQETPLFGAEKEVVAPVQGANQQPVAVGASEKSKPKV